ncbi:FKBP-type peptidyl-prolyl cis-trans isomerase [Candidatus Magnetaquicoccus inordinatus]|uniref:FKBP-type peptidyl-prolyl cis-trans isomerase n=1 Tax=Candidatus Magnetaquicoccus inordinatus TaxID=2496818 RepID=UPI00102AD063|nr:FKBP-type peptidyl-prolyl cis-trans isomerase [Candidatus Magnetaquicoccus inordinatus]
MKILLAPSVALLLLCGTSLAPAQADDSLKTLKDRFSYALGLQIGTDISQMKDKLDANSFIRGIQDQLAGKKLLMTPEEIGKAKEEFQKSMLEEMQKESQNSANKNRSEGEQFLAKNKERKGVITTSSGLQYEILTPGNGPKPKATDTVKVHYQGTLLDGSEFDSSYKRKEPVSFPLDRVIPGWTEGLQLMPTGAKYRFFIPSDLAYGKRGAPPKIGGDATLQFEVELLEIVK